MQRAGQETRLFTDATWPAGEWTWGPITRLRGETARRFADELEKARPHEHCDLLLSLERVWRCDVYRAGDGIHQSWLRRRDAASSTLQRVVRRFGRSHRDTLELEEALFRGGAGRVIANSEMVKKEAQTFTAIRRNRSTSCATACRWPTFRPDASTRGLWRRNLGLAEEEIAVLFVGSGWERKGLAAARAAVESLGGNFRLLVAGRGGRTASQQFGRSGCSARSASCPRFMAPRIFSCSRPATIRSRTPASKRWLPDYRS